MHCQIHRGANEIGGSAIELIYQNHKLLLDAGLPLSSDSNTALLPVTLAPDDPQRLAIIVSHPHQDHYGLLRYMAKNTQLVTGGASERIINAASAFVPNGFQVAASKHLEDRKVFSIGPFTITPFLMDHSGYDSYALLIEAGGKRFFYSGDLRAHGRKASLFEAFVKRPPNEIDVLLMEGSTIGRLSKDKNFQTEQEIETDLVCEARKTSGPLLVCASAQNIDRMVSIYRAAKKTGRNLIIDLYAAAVLEATEGKRIPQSNWPNIKLYVPEWQRRHIARNKMFDLLKRHSANRIFKEDIKEAAPTSFFLFRTSLAQDLLDAAALKGAHLVWSQWDGYLKDEGNRALYDFLAKTNIPMRQIHTSGHASISDLQRFTKAIKPNRLVPIHSFSTDRFVEFFENVQQKPDGEIWEI